MANWKDWLNEAKRDLDAAENLGQAGFYAQACFLCQQGIEKALKANLLLKTNKFPKIHSLIELARLAGVLDELRDHISELDTDYVATRYLDLAGMPTTEIYTRKEFLNRLKQARKAMEMIVEWTKG